MKRCLFPETGFTLVEILVAFLIFSIVLLPLTAVLVAESKFERKHELKQVAILVAKNEIERSKTFRGVLENKEYIIDMAGVPWNVRREIENKEIAVAGAGPKDAIQNCLITISVGRANDTATLAVFRVMKETY
jgi:type II secretory pathway pseudopilin PulG